MTLTLEEKKEELQKLRAKKELMIGLPHLYGFKFYPWARKVFDSNNRLILLCAANQISKSSTAIRKCVEMAGNPDIWHKYWKTTPRQFWYLYPSKEVATVEFEKKWLPEFMPRGAFKEHPTYGWQIIYKHGSVNEIRFNTGVSVYFKAYSQDVQRLQSGTCHAIFCDEELPVDLFDELNFRLEAVDGMFCLVFTATLGQTFWRHAIEEIGKPKETLKGALKLQVSMYDCLSYEDGSTTPWSIEKIKRAKSKCSTDAQIQRRIYGKFVVDEGLIYKSFSSARNCVTWEEFNKKNSCTGVPKDWDVYGAVDIGSGQESHPAAIIFLATRPDNKYGVVFKGRRLDDVGKTTSADILDVYRALRGNRNCTSQCYDWQAVDFSTYANRVEEPFEKADKSKTAGEDTINVLFKNKMLDIISEPTDLIWEPDKLIEELESLRFETSKTHAKDDFCDALRYDVQSVTWDFSGVCDNYQEFKEPAPTTIESEIEQRRKEFDTPAVDNDSIDKEIEFFNDLYD